MGRQLNHRRGHGAIANVQRDVVTDATHPVRRESGMQRAEHRTAVGPLEGGNLARHTAEAIV